METPKGKYVKRTQKDYSYAFKLQVVSEIERGELNKKVDYGQRLRAENGDQINQ